ncbi:MAG: GTP-binding protein [Methanomassiliicoccales archaeon]|nr:MAG: GTP-binding protein [Methanomassiliicoccales archaeon]
MGWNKDNKKAKEWLVVTGSNLVKFKICLLGEGAVGKTSLIKRYVFDEFDETYHVTIGTKVTKKELKIRHPETDETLDVYLMIWDLMGQQCFLDLLKVSYFFGARGLIAMCDVTRKETLSELTRWMEVALSVTDDIPIIFLGNKCDLEKEQQLSLEEVKTFASIYDKSETYLSSVKTGYNVDLIFKTLSERMIMNIK